MGVAILEAKRSLLYSFESPKLQNKVAVYLYLWHGACNLRWYIFKAQQGGEENNAETSFDQTDPEKESLSCAPTPLVLLKSSLQARQ